MRTRLLVVAVFLALDEPQALLALEARELPIVIREFGSTAYVRKVASIHVAVAQPSCDEFRKNRDPTIENSAKKDEAESNQGERFTFEGGTPKIEALSVKVRCKTEEYPDRRYDLASPRIGGFTEKPG